jgi:general secretion pathway protein J
MTRRQRHSGFTLLELLVAITILSVVSIISWRGLESLVTTRERLEPLGDDVRALLTTFGQMERDLSQVANPRFLGLTSSPLEIDVVSGETTLQLVRVAPGQPDRATEIQAVYYRVVDGILVRQATAAQPGAERVPTDRYETARLLTGVRSIQVRRWTPGVGWTYPNADPAAAPPPAAGVDPRTTPPPGIEVSLERTDGKQFRRVFLVGA